MANPNKPVTFLIKGLFQENINKNTQHCSVFNLEANALKSKFPQITIIIAIVITIIIIIHIIDRIVVIAIKNIITRVIINIYKITTLPMFAAIISFSFHEIHICKNK